MVVRLDRLQELEVRHDVQLERLAFDPVLRHAGMQPNAVPVAPAVFLRPRCSDHPSADPKRPTHGQVSVNERRFFLVGEQLRFGSAGLGASTTAFTFRTDRRIRKCSHVSTRRGIGIILKTFDDSGDIGRQLFFAQALDPFPE